MSAVQHTHSARRVEGIVPERTLLGIVLVVVGTIIALGFVTDATDRYTLVSISATLLVAFALTREYGYAIPGGITGGIGAAILFITGQTFGPAMTPAVLFLSMAGGFLAVWLLGLTALPQERHPWPLVPATILGLLGTAFAAGQPGAIEWIQIGVAVAIILAGTGLVLRRDHTAS
ncbi:MAG: hypothetical protein ACJ761_06005 [Chloroflexota bacterium]